MLVLFIIIVLTGFVIAGITPEGSIIPIIYAITIVLLSFVAFVDWWKGMCKNCGNSYAYEEIDRNLISRREIKRYKTESRYNHWRDSYEYYEVPDKPYYEYKYRVTERCKYCRDIRKRTEKITSEW